MLVLYYIIWAILFVSYYMGHTNGAILYGPHSWYHIIWSILMVPYNMGHTISVILYGPYYKRNVIWPYYLCHIIWAKLYVCGTLKDSISPRVQRSHQESHQHGFAHCQAVTYMTRSPTKLLSYVTLIPY